jgi:hypothetical protein
MSAAADAPAPHGVARDADDDDTVTLVASPATPASPAPPAPPARAALLNALGVTTVMLLAAAASFANVARTAPAPDAPQPAGNASTARAAQVAVNALTPHDGGLAITFAVDAAPGGAPPAAAVAWTTARGAGVAPASAVRYESRAAVYPGGLYTSPWLFSAAVPSAPGERVAFELRVEGGAPRGGFAAAALPAPGTPGVAIAVCGDVGVGAASAATLRGIADVHAATPLKGVVLVGDISYADGDERIWDAWGAQAETLAASVPFLTAAGNHEWRAEYQSIDGTFAGYAARTRNPLGAGASADAGFFWSVDAGLMHIVAAAGYCTASGAGGLPCLAPGSPQRAWLERDLAGVDRALTPWVILILHQPWVNSNLAHSRATEGAPARDALDALVRAAGVDLVVSGHVHAYERSCRVAAGGDSGGYCVSDASAPYYITVGDGGNREVRVTRHNLRSPAAPQF